jgi:hypothetical protein
MAKRGANSQRATQAPTTGRDKAFCYNGFTVMVPISVLDAWDARLDKQREMIAVLRTHLARLRDKPISEGIRFKLEFGRVPGEPLSETAKKLANPGVKKAVLKLLKYGHYRDWHLSPIRYDFTRAVTIAAVDGDAAFFKALGERLKKPCKPGFRISKLKELLLFNWIGTGICFCWFTDRALLDFIKLTEKDGAPFTMDAIRLERDRLELPKLRPALVRSIKQDGERILLNGAKPPRASTHFVVGLTLADYMLMKQRRESECAQPRQKRV